MGRAQIHNLAVLSDDDCWLLFSCRALEHRSAEECSGLEDIGREIVRKCGGVPLAAKTIGSAMCSRRTRRHWELVLRSEIWMSGDVLGVVLPALLLSYHDLPPALKQCFTYCSVFPKDWKIEKDVLVKLWVAQGFIRSDVSGDMEEIGGLYFDDLIRRSLFQDAELDGDKIKCKCKMHDLVHDLAQSIAGSDYSSLVEIGKQALSHLNNVRHSFLIVSNESDGDEAGDESDGDEAGDESDGAGDESDGDEAGDESDGAGDESDGDEAGDESDGDEAGDESHGDEAGDESDGDEDDEVAYIWAPLYKAHKLRTLLHGWLTIPIKMVPNNVFHQLKCLRALDLSVTAIKELPQTVGQLIHLRYLDLSQTFIKELPEEVSNCINLQTLRLNRCEELSELPRGPRKMISLRHLEFEGADELKYLPHGIGRLTELRTLTKFIVGGDDQGRKCGELKHLNHLQGSLQIEDLGNVRSREEAREAQLYKKQYLHALIFKYSRHINDEPSSDDEVKRMEDVLEILQPHTNLKEFSLTGYEGSKLPKWIEDPVFSNLVQVKLSRCYKCKQLPGLGKLPSLKYLEIEGMEEVRKVGGEFSGDDNNDGSSGGGGVSFPKLQTLIFSNMTKWEEWELRGGDGEVMSSLLELQIKECLNLKALPSNLPVLLLQKLSISIGNDGLPSGGPLPVLPNLNELVICRSPELTSFPCGWLGQLKALQTLEIQNCRNLRSLPEELQHLTVLQHLEIYDCPLLKECFREGEDRYKISHIPSVSFRELPKADERGITFEGISLVHITHGFTVIMLI